MIDTAAVAGGKADTLANSFVKATTVTPTSRTSLGSSRTLDFLGILMNLRGMTCSTQQVAVALQRLEN